MVYLLFLLFTPVLLQARSTTLQIEKGCSRNISIAQIEFPFTNAIDIPCNQYTYVCFINTNYSTQTDDQLFLRLDLPANHCLQVQQDNKAIQYNLLWKVKFNKLCCPLSGSLDKETIISVLRKSKDIGGFPLSLQFIKSVLLCGVISVVITIGFKKYGDRIISQHRSQKKQ